MLFVVLAAPGPRLVLFLIRAEKAKKAADKDDIKADEAQASSDAGEGGGWRPEASH